MRTFFPVFALASVMLATSCSNDELNSVNGGTNSTVTLNAQLENGMKSRAFGDGTTAKTLDYAVYEVKDGNWTLLDKLGKTGEAINLTKTISLNLVNGKSYAVVFWADAANSIYTFSATDKKVTANYTNATCSNEACDAFYAVEKFTVDGENLYRTVSLKRPFAQLNIGTSDLEAAAESGVDVKKTAVTVNTYNTLNFVDGSVSGNKKDVTFAAAELPKSETFPVTSSDCDYLAMSYLLMPTDKDADNTVTISYYGTDGSTKVADDRTFQNIPLQRNYRTNIFGALLTSTNVFTVTITPAFDEPYFGPKVWDGSTKEVTETEGVYEIYEASELAWVAQQTASGTNNFSGKTIKLMDDFDLKNLAWTPIGDNSNAAYPGTKTFRGTFDGNGKTIYNVNVASPNVNANYAAAGFFGTIAGATIKNLTLKNVTVRSTHYAGAIVGYSSTGYKNTIEGCTVDGASVISTPALKGAELDATVATNYDNGDKVGGIIGYVGYALIKDNTVKNATVKAYRDLGGIVGCASGNTEDTAPVVLLTGNKIENVTLIVDKTYNYNSYTTQAKHNVDNYVGRNIVPSGASNPTATLENNTGEATIVY